MNGSDPVRMFDWAAASLGAVKQTWSDKWQMNYGYKIVDHELYDRCRRLWRPTDSPVRAAVQLDLTASGLIELVR